VGGEALAVAADRVAEVIRRPRLTRVPLVAPSFVGVANLRGSVIPVLSVAALLGHGDGAGASRIIVVREPEAVGLLVDEVAALVPLGSVGAEAGARLVDVAALIGANFAAARPQRASEGRLAAPAAGKRAVARQAFLSFAIGVQEFALPLESVREVLALPRDIASVPRTDSAMLGVMPLRGALLPLLSLPVLLGLPAGESAGRRVVVAVLGGTPVGLVVDGVREILKAAAEDVDPVPPVLTRGDQEAQIRAICRLDGGRRLVSILSTDHLLRDGLAEQLAGDGEDNQQMQAGGGAGGAERDSGEQFVVFRLGEERYGLPIASVDEVVALPSKLTRLPRAPGFVEGVFSLRGRVIPVIDQRQRFDVAGGAVRRARVLVVHIGEAQAGFIVDEVSEVLRVAADQLRDAPEIGSAGPQVIDRIANLGEEGGMIPIVDPRELLDRADRDMLAAFQRDPPPA
jgi:purine-binding chemotaxis protein CheW